MAKPNFEFQKRQKELEKKRKKEEKKQKKLDRAAAQTPRQVTTIVTGGAVVTVDSERHIYNPGAVAIDGTTIVAVGPASDSTRASMSLTVVLPWEPVMPTT